MTRLARGFELLSLALVVWGSSGVFMPVELVLDRVWGGSGPRSFWKSRLLAFALTVAGGALALLSVALTLLVRGFGRDWPLVAGSAAKAAALLLSWTLFLLVYRLVPRARVDLRVAARAALWAAVLWEASKYAFVWNLGRMQLADVLRPARVRGGARALGLRLERRAGLRRRDGPGGARSAARIALASRR